MGRRDRGEFPLTSSVQPRRHEMKRKMLVVALAVMASLLVATNAFAATSIYCTGGANLKFVGVGSSAQTNALAYAAKNVVNGAHGGYALISFKGTSITDKRATLTDTGFTTWIVYDPTATSTACDAYVYFQTDSGVGVKKIGRASCRERV